jgi:adenylyltransferase/sulfurtransferase
MMNLRANQFTPTLMKQRWLTSCCLAVVLGTVATIFTVRQNPDSLRPMLRAGVPLEWADDWKIVGSAIRDAEMREANISQMSVQQLKQLIDKKATNYLLVDVRTTKEYTISRIPGALLVPLTEIQQGAGINEVKSLLKGRDLIIYCTSGHRSAKALLQLNKAGIKGTQVKGGIKAWSEEIDPSIPHDKW